MSIRYTPDELVFLRSSPLVVKPVNLPLAEQWMGVPAENVRNPSGRQSEKLKGHDSDFLLDQTNKRPALERHVSRNSANPEDIILGPPKTSFMSATSIRNPGKSFDSLDRGTGRDGDTRDRFNFRTNRTGEGENDRPRERRNNNLQVRRAEGDQDSDGWSTVKPRKSFGTEGAERFNGRMGLDTRQKEDRRFKDREARDVKDRPRGFDNYSREKDNEDQERDGRRNGSGRGRNESWFKDNSDSQPTPNRNSNGDRIVDRSRGWREKDHDERDDRGTDRRERGERGDRRDRGGDRPDRGDRRWDKDQRQERDPEWNTGEIEGDDSHQAHTQADFQKWKEQMAGKDKPSAKTPVAETPTTLETGGGFFGFDKPQKVETPLAMDTGPDKFFGKWATPTQEASQDSGIESRKEGLAKATSSTTGKASRFTSFFAPQEDPHRRQAESQSQVPIPMPPQGGVEGMFRNESEELPPKAKAMQQADFQRLLQQLQSSSIVPGSGSTPPLNAALQSKPPAQENQQSVKQAISVSTPESFQQYRTERHDEARLPTRNSQQQALQDLLAQRQGANSQPSARPEQVIQDLIGQRQNPLAQSSGLPDHPPVRNQNTDFLMGLMRSAKAAPEPQRSEQVLLRMPPGQKSSIDRERQQYEEMRAASQRQPRPQAPPGLPGFFDEASFQRGPPPQNDRQPNNPQPTQILQRGAHPPPGLDLGWDRQQQIPAQHRINNPGIPPPPGLAGAPNRNAMHMPPQQQQMYPPGFPMGNFPPEMAGPPRQMGMAPPPGFFQPPPPGFLPPGMNGGFPGGLDGPFGGFDGRGPPSNGAYRRQ